MGYSKPNQRVEYLLAPYMISEDLSVENKQELKALESFKRLPIIWSRKKKGGYLPVLGAFGSVTYTAFLTLR
ncbi:MAG: hypothetical protein R2759_13695 [Bacteroidales bacterium]